MTLLAIEQEPQSDESPGIIECDTAIVRGFWKPNHLNASYEIRPSAFRAADVKTGTVSCWRTETHFGFSLQLAIDKSREQVPPNGNEFYHSEPIVRSIREIMYNESEQIRSFAVVDDCSIDYMGGTHEMHCGIQRNPVIPWPDNLTEIAEFEQVTAFREMLKKAFERFLVLPAE